LTRDVSDVGTDAGTDVNRIVRAPGPLARPRESTATLPKAANQVDELVEQDHDADRELDPL
jgi:hypothetical protein